MSEQGDWTMVNDADASPDGTTPEPMATGGDAPMPGAEAAPGPEQVQESAAAVGPKRRVVVLIADGGRRPADPIDEAEAAIVLAGVSAPWHPAILARLGAIPAVEDVAAPTAPAEGEVRLVVGRAVGQIRAGYRDEGSEVGVPVLMVEAGEADRDALARLILEAIEPGADLGPADDPTARDFHALGAARWWVRDLTVGMDHVDVLDAEGIAREAIGGAKAWADGDPAGAVNRLRAAFELLTEARERIYPVDSFLVDLHLLDPSAPADALRDALDARSPFTLVAAAQAIEAIAEKAPEDAARLRGAIDEGWADVVGGPYAESAEGLRPVETILWQFREGADTYRRHLDDRTVETLAGRRFALYPMRPQVARRFGFRYGLHLAFDDGTFPVARESKRLWESPEGANLEALTRTPLAADREATGLSLAWEMAKSMKDDHVATVVLVHWPGRVAGWFRDLRRVAAYAPVLARWATVGDYFHLTDRPYEVIRPKLDQYATPYLDQAVSRGDPSPIGRRVRHARLRARLDRADGLRSIASALDFVGDPLPVEDGAAPMPAGASEFAEAARLLETGRLDEAEDRIAAIEARWSAEASRRVVPPGAEGNGTGPGEGPGDLILNPVSIPRRVAVALPEAAGPIPAGGAVRCSQYTEKGTEAVVTLAGFGFAWIPRARPGIAAAPDGPSETVQARGKVLRNEMIAVEVDEATGGIRSLKAPGEGEARLGQQLVIAGVSRTDRKGQTRHSRMVLDGFEVEYGGPALVQAASTGRILDPIEDRTLARFRQRYRLWGGRPVLELEITLSDLDPNWLATIAAGPAWSRYLACRWAWPDANATLRRSSLLGLEATTADRPETAEILDITARRQRTALLFGGLAHHQRHGQRMLDTLLVAGKEEERTFRIGVALDLEHPFQAAIDLQSPPVVVPTAGGPPRSGPVGWFFHLDAKSVAVTRVEPVILDGEGRGLAFHLLETAGRSSRCKLRLFREPVWARQTDFHDERIVELSVQGDAVQLDLTPHELARVVVSLG